MYQAGSTVASDNDRLTVLLLICFLMAGQKLDNNIGTCEWHTSHETRMRTRTLDGGPFDISVRAEETFLLEGSITEATKHRQWSRGTREVGTKTSVPSKNSEIGWIMISDLVAVIIVIIIEGLLLIGEILGLIRKEVAVRKGKQVVTSIDSSQCQQQKQHQPMNVNNHLPSGQDLDTTPAKTPSTDGSSISVGERSEYRSFGNPPKAKMKMLVPMTAPGTPGAPYFNGNNATDFLERYNDLCEDFEVSDVDRAKKVVRYCESSVGKYIRTLKEYQDQDWMDLQRVIRKEWEKEDDEQRMKTLAFLEELKNRDHETRDEIRQYCRQFRITSQALREEGRLAAYQQCQWFLQGLPTSLLRKVVKKLSIREENATTMKFEEAYKFVLEDCEVEEGIERLKATAADAVSLKELAKEAETRPRVGSRNDDGIMVPSVPISAPALPAKYEEDLANLMSGMKLATARMEHIAATMTAPQRRPAMQRNWRVSGLDPALQRNAEPTPPEFNDKHPNEQWFEYMQRTNRCHFCEAVGCRDFWCPLKAEMIKDGLICEIDRKICLGTPEKRNPPIDFYGLVGGKVRRIRQLAQGLVKESEPAPAMIASVRVEVNQDTDEEEGLEESLTVAAGRVDRVRKPSLKATLADPTSARVVKERKEREQRLPAMKTVRYGAYITPQESADTAREDQAAVVESQPTRSVERQGHIPSPRRVRLPVVGPQKLQNVLKEVRGAEKMARAVLSAPVAGSSDMEVQDYLALAEVRQIVFNKKRWEKDGVGNIVIADDRASISKDQIMVGSLQVSNRPLRSAECPKLWTKVGGCQALGLYDTGSMVNLVSRKRAEELGYTIYTVDDVDAVSFGGVHSRFYGYMKDVPIEVSGVVVPSYVFIVEFMDDMYDILLGQPFQKATMAATWHDDERRLHLRFWDPETSEDVEVLEVRDADLAEEDDDEHLN